MCNPLSDSSLNRKLSDRIFSKSMAMKRILYFAAIIICLCSCHSKPIVTVEHDGDNAMVTIDGKCRYLLLPVQDKSWEVRVRMADASGNEPPMNIRLAADSIDYYVPFELPRTKGKKTISFSGLWPGAVCWKNLMVSDEIPEVVYEKYRPLYHHSPVTGWMNDPNGMFYKDGEYHLYYQHNPYGNRWGNMHWSHSSSKDLIHWTNHSVAIAPDSLGTIFSGSAVVDKDNTAGFGENAVVAFYTSEIPDRPQVQSMAYSLDNGKTFIKYPGNPVVTPHDGIRDFRDPKVIRYEDRWIMVLAANYEVRFYSSADLKNWEYTGSFGKGYGPQPALFECPDLVKLPVDGNMSRSRWMLFVNVNPGGPFGSSACQYFIGDFDGKTFVCDTEPQVTKWLDYGKDHYAAVTFSNTEDRAIAVAWMSAWPYADRTPTEQFRSVNSLPRDIRLFSVGDDIYASAMPSEEVYALRSSKSALGSFSVGDSLSNEVSVGGLDAYEVSFSLHNQKKGKTSVSFHNKSGEKFSVDFDTENMTVKADRSESGLMTDIESYVQMPDAPLDLCTPYDGYDVDIFIDKCSVEIFIDGGRVAMTNLVFPAEQFDRIMFDGTGKTEIRDLCVYKIGK